MPRRVLYRRARHLPLGGLVGLAAWAVGLLLAFVSVAPLARADPVSISPDGDAEADCLAVSGTGGARTGACLGLLAPLPLGGVAVGGGGASCSHSGCVAVAGDGDADCGAVVFCVAVGLLGDARCVSSALCLAASVGGDATVQRVCDFDEPEHPSCSSGAAVSVAGRASCPRVDGSGRCYAVSVASDAGGDVAVSVFGHANGTTAVGGCDLHAFLCRDL